MARKDVSGRRLLSFLFFLCCAAGFGYQMFLVTKTYFDYDVLTKTEINSPNYIETPVLSVCFRYGEIFDYESYKQTHPESSLSFESGKAEDFEQMKKEMTIAELFEFTAKSDDILQACFVRRAGKYFREGWHDTGECNRVFSVTKFFILEYICYMIKSQELEMQKMEHLMFTTDHPGLVVQVTLNRSLFARSDRIRPLVHGNSLPTIVVGYSSPVRRNVDPATGEAQFNYFTLSNSQVKTMSLEPPYNTKCMQYETMGIDGGRRACLITCMTDGTTEKFGKVFFSDAISESKDLKIVSREDIEGTNTSIEFQAIESRCSRLCHRPECEDYFFVSETRVVPANLESGIIFRVEAPKHVFYNTIYSAKMLLMDYFIYVSSLFGVWFGFSAWDINPVLVFEKLRSVREKKMKKKKEAASKSNEMTERRLSKRERMKNSFLEVKNKPSHYMDRWYARHNQQYMDYNFVVPQTQFYVNYGHKGYKY